MGKDVSNEGKRVLSFASRNDLFSCDNLIVGLSGGPDSTALLMLLKELKDSGYIKGEIFAIHVNHNLRGEDAQRDEEFSKALAQKAGIPFYAFSFRVKEESEKTGRSEEETGRILRYQAFRRFARENIKGSYKIAVAHHRDDITETFLMNLFRGCGLEGLTSPSPVNGDVIRPLLCLSKSEILDYLETRGIPYVKDHTNDLTECTRNRWRNDLIPKIAEVSVKDPGEAVNDTYQLLTDDLSFIASVVEENYVPERIGDLLCLNREDLKKQHPAIRSRLIRRLWEESFGDLVDLSRVHMESITELLEKDTEGTSVIDMPFSRKCFITGTRLGFCEAAHMDRAMDDISRDMGLVTVPADLMVPVVPGTESFITRNIEVVAEIVEKRGAIEYNNLSWFYPDTEGALTLRAAVNTMSFKRAGSSCTKSLKKLFTERRVPSPSRERILIVTDGDRVLWIPGIGHAEGFTDEVSHKAWLRENGTPERLLKISLIIGEDDD